MTLEEELKALDFEIRRLKVQYDLYFQGATPRPPTDQHGALSRAMRKLQGVEMRNMAERFIYNNVVNKFNTFQELWNKMMRMKEEGARVHPLAARAAKRAALAETGGSAGPVPPPAQTPTPPAANQEAKRAAVAAAFRIQANQPDEAPIRRLYESFIAARNRSGDARPLGFDSFAREIARQTAALQAKNPCEAVEFKIYSKDNKVALKVRAVGKSEGS
ncbi:MAG TPA: MXAN_5187 C-terminal domain-containing protein [Candidatus Polarisedimenticolia bacterium]|nr:MXAN_5187 C-terminal domain-containing protein [Candidatus Polarisedimenticolia bacterium]